MPLAPDRVGAGQGHRTTMCSATLPITSAAPVAAIHHLAEAMRRRDLTTGHHSDRIGVISALVAGALGWSPDDVELMRLAAPMHDVGKLVIPDRILLKPGPLTRAQRSEMERHAVIGYEILAGSDSALLRLAADIALTHHEWIDGSGYPNGLGGWDIPQAGRIVAVADVFDALTHDRPYRRAIPLGAACEILDAGRGSQFDPEVLDALLSRVDTIAALEPSRVAA